MNFYKHSRIFMGLILLAIGGIFLLRQFGFVSFSIGHLFATFWPVILIVIGAQNMTIRGGGWWGIFMVALGGFFLLRNLNVIDLSFGEIIRYGWPLILIWWGLSFLFRTGSDRKKNGNGWQSYPPKPGGPFDSDKPVPPAPPLHPNPLDLDYEKPGDDKSGGGTHAEGSFGGEDKGNASGTGAADGWSGPGGSGYGGGPGYGGNPGYDGHGGSAGKHSGWRGHHRDTETRSGFIGDIHIGGDYWELRPLNVSLFIGDTVLDLTKAQIPYGETRINVSSFIGDVKVFVPNDYELGINVTANTFIGDTRVLERKESGMFKNVVVETPWYHESDKRIKLVVSSFIGDVRVIKVG